MKTKIVYPSIPVWNASAPRILFVNPNEFRIEDRLKLLGLENHPLRDSFGCADREEILRRQELMKFLVENPDVGDLLITFADSREVFATPDNGQEFIAAFKGDSQFWKAMACLRSSVNSARGPIPRAVSQLLEFVNSLEHSQKPAEKEMADETSELLSRAIVAGGTLTLRYSYDQTGSTGYWSIMDTGTWTDEFFGYRMFSSDLPPKLPGKPFGGKNSFMQKLLAPCTWARSIVWKIRNWMWLRPLQLSRLPKVIQESIVNRVTSLLNAEAQGIDWHQVAGSQFDRMTFVVAYSVGERGTTMRLADFSSSAFSPEACFVPLMMDRHKYPHRIARKMNRFNERVASKSAKLYNLSVGLAAFIQKLREVDKRFVESGVAVRIGGQITHWESVRGFLASQRKFMDVYRTSDDIRAFTKNVIREIASVAKIAQKFTLLSKKWNIPLEFPEILDDREHLISFDQLLPIHLIGRPLGQGDKVLKPSEIIPVRSMAPLNGNMVGFTGQNKGGKTATEEEVAFLIHDAQSGFPLFGARNVKLNVKNTVGLVFLERGKGSTVELMLKKLASVVDTAKAHARNGTVVILDELGTGTQESGGLRIGRGVLSELSKTHCSVVFSTQIQELAEFAEEKLGAKCYAFDLNHRVRPGIDSGHPELLAEQLGVADTLGLNSN